MPGSTDATGAAGAGDSGIDWSWPPYAPIEAAGTPFDTPDWAPPSVVWHPRFRVGRWTLVYARSA